MRENIDWATARSIISNNFARMARFDFTYDNILFWIIFVVLCMLLIEAWGFKRSLSFCSTVAILLLGIPKIESWWAKTFCDPGTTADFGVVKLIALFLIAIICLIYATMKR